MMSTKLLPTLAFLPLRILLSSIFPFNVTAMSLLRCFTPETFTFATSHTCQYVY
jgi:hypothetical protein